MKKLYFISIFPPAELLEEIRRIKEDMRRRFDASHALKIAAHITLQPPINTSEEEEPLLIATLASCADKQRPFEVYLSGFGSFPPRVLFIHVKHSPDLSELHEKIKKSMSPFSNEKPQRENQVFHPHINIASKDLSKKSYSKAWQEFKNRKYEATFVADSFLLLKHDGKSWQPIQEFNFKK